MTLRCVEHGGDGGGEGVCRLRSTCGIRHARDYSPFSYPPRLPSGLQCPRGRSRSARPDGRASDCASAAFATRGCSRRCARFRATCSCPEAQRGTAYEDRALPIASGQTISQPYIVAIMTELLGAGSPSSGPGDWHGIRISDRRSSRDCRSEVISIERHPELAEAARAVFETLGITNVDVRVGDGTEGLPEDAPFDRILVTAGAPAVPDSLKQQLAPWEAGWSFLSVRRDTSTSPSSIGPKHRLRAARARRLRVRAPDWPPRLESLAQLGQLQGVSIPTTVGLWTAVLKCVYLFA